MNLYQIVRRPIITEKALTAKEAANTMVLEVHPDANKIQVKQAVEKVFNVKVANVRSATFEGKLRRRGAFTGYRSDWKKVFVRLTKDSKMPEYAEL